LTEEENNRFAFVMGMFVADAYNDFIKNNEIKVEYKKIIKKEMTKYANSLMMQSNTQII